MPDFDAEGFICPEEGTCVLECGCCQVLREKHLAAAAEAHGHAAGFCEGDSAGFKRGVEACKEKVRSLFPTHGDAARYDSPVKNSLALVIQVLDEDLLGKEPS